MSDDSQGIKVVGIDKEAIEMRSDKQIWGIPFKLSLKPDQDWQKKFYDVQQRDKNVMKRRIKIVGDFITVEVFETDDLQKVLDALRLEVAETNVLCEGDYQTKLKIRRELEALQQKQGDLTKKFKDDSDKLQF
jgi:uncharacterized protein YajQ (UPF0234 family)